MLHMTEYYVNCASACTDLHAARMKQRRQQMTKEREVKKEDEEKHRVNHNITYYILCKIHK